MPEPLFILAPPRSYASQVVAMLGMHPQCYGFPELNLFISDHLSEINNPAATQGLLRAVAELYTGEQTISSIMMARHWLARRSHQSTAEIYQELVGKVSPLLAVESSPAFVYQPESLRRILVAFPAARFLHLVRHPMAQCESVMADDMVQQAVLVPDSIDYTGAEAVPDAQIAWHDTNANILELLDSLPNTQWLRVQGEQLLSEHDVYLPKLCQWLGIRADDLACEAMTHPERSPFAHIGPVFAQLGGDPEFLRRPSLASIGVDVPSLDQPLPWRPDGGKFQPAVVNMAREFGYGN